MFSTPACLRDFEDLEDESRPFLAQICDPPKLEVLPDSFWVLRAMSPSRVFIQWAITRLRHQKATDELVVYYNGESES